MDADEQLGMDEQLANGEPLAIAFSNCLPMRKWMRLVVGGGPKLRTCIHAVCWAWAAW